jgi:hypothetical protein
MIPLSCYRDRYFGQCCGPETYCQGFGSGCDFSKSSGSGSDFWKVDPVSDPTLVIYFSSRTMIFKVFKWHFKHNFQRILKFGILWYSKIRNWLVFYYYFYPVSDRDPDPNPKPRVTDPDLDPTKSSGSHKTDFGNRTTLICYHVQVLMMLC